MSGLKWGVAKKGIRRILLGGTAMLAVIGTSGRDSATAADVSCGTLYYCAVNVGDNVTISTTATGSTSGLSGFGIYLNGGQYKLNQVTISTLGDKADAIRTNRGDSFVYVNSLIITATGNSADGINLASNFNDVADGVVYIRDYANINVTSGIAVRANNFQNADANTVIFLPNGATITVSGTGTAQNMDSGDGYAVYAGNRDIDINGLGNTAQGQNNNTLGNSYVFVGSDATIATNTGSGYAVYANKGGLIQLGDGANVSTTGLGAYALYAATEQQGTYTSNVRPGYIFLGGGATLRAANSDIVMQANGVGSIIASKSMTVPTIPDTFTNSSRVQGLDKGTTQETSGVFDIIGKMDAFQGGEISLNMANGSSFVGSTDIHLENATASAINLNISGPTSKWILNANSTLSTLNLGSGATLQPYRVADETTSYSLQGAVTNGGVINLAGAALGDSFTINGTYTGNNGTLSLNTLLNAGGALSNQRTDRLLINGNVTGVTMVNIVANLSSPGGATSAAGTNLASEGISIIQVSGSAAENSFQLPGGYVTLGGMPYQYSLYAYGPGSSRGAADESQRLVTTGDPHWDYRLQNVYVPPRPPTPLTPPVAPPDPNTTTEATRVLAVAPQLASYLLAPTALFQAGLMDISNLHRRLGDIRDDRVTGRNSGTGEFFIRAYGGKYDYASNRDAYTYGYNADIDYAAVQMGGNLFAFENKNSVTRFGVAGSIGSLSFDPKNVTGTTSTTLDTWSVSAYATYLHDSGWYVDGLLSYGGFDGHVSTTLKGRTASVSGNSFSASIETGYPFKFGDGLVLEPQAQLIYQRLMFSRKLDVADHFYVALGNQDQVTARVGARLSKTFAQNEKDKLITIYAKANVLHSFNDSSKVFLGDTFRLGEFGTSIEGGLGINATLSKNLSLYADAAYQHKIGKSGVSGVSFTGGLRYTF